MEDTETNQNRLMYARLAGMAALSFIAMYFLMYAMVNSLGDVFNNLNQVYMAALMAPPMVLIELALMRPMYRQSQWNLAIVIISAVVMVIAFLGIRLQIGVGDTQLVRSMVPHHSGALLMCREAALEDPQLRELCAKIIANQQSEIDEMNAILSRLAR
ncbi:MAG: DUF305 domain-containing protein [Chloroflexota bacterium]